MQEMLSSFHDFSIQSVLTLYVCYNYHDKALQNGFDVHINTKRNKHVLLMSIMVENNIQLFV